MVTAGALYGRKIFIENLSKKPQEKIFLVSAQQFFRFGRVFRSGVEFIDICGGGIKVNEKEDFVDVLQKTLRYDIVLMQNGYGQEENRFFAREANGMVMRFLHTASYIQKV